MTPLFSLIRREAFHLLRSSHGLGPLFFALAGGCGLLILLMRYEEGHVVQFPALWGLATAFGLPFIVAVASSRGFTLDRERGMMRLMFSTPLSARGWVIAKIFAAWSLALVYILGMAVAAWVILHWLMPEAQLPWQWNQFIIAGIALTIEGLLWSSIGTLVSLLFRSSASTFLVALLACLMGPPLLCISVAHLLPEAVSQWPWFPLQFIVYDCASGIIHLHALIVSLLVALLLIHLSSVVFDCLRILGKEK